MSCASRRTNQFRDENDFLIVLCFSFKWYTVLLDVFCSSLLKQPQSFCTVHNACGTTLIFDWDQSCAFSPPCPMISRFGQIVSRSPLSRQQQPHLTSPLRSPPPCTLPIDTCCLRLTANNNLTFTSPLLSPPPCTLPINTCCLRLTAPLQPKVQRKGNTERERPLQKQKETKLDPVVF